MYLISVAMVYNCIVSFPLLKMSLINFFVYNNVIVEMKFTLHHFWSDGQFYFDCPLYHFPYIHTSIRAYIDTSSSLVTHQQTN